MAAPKFPLVALPLAESAVRAWTERITRARDERKQHAETWELLLKEYLPTVKASGVPELLKTNAHFRNVENKKALLFFGLPEIVLTPEFPLREPMLDPRTGQPFTQPDGSPVTGEDLVPIKQAYLRKLLGPDGVDLERTINQVLFDVLCPAGRGAVAIGYRAYVEDLKDPETGQPLPHVVHEEYFVDRISPKRLLTPDNFDSTDFERAAWLGYEFELPLREARRLYQLPEDFTPATGGDDDLAFKAGRLTDRGERPRDLVRGTAIWYRAYLFVDQVVNPELLHELVLIGQTPVVHRRCPWQQLDQRGRLTPSSLRGFPIEVLTLRDLADSSYPPSDCAVTHAQVKELNTYRRQEIRRRDANITKFIYDPDALPLEAVEKLKKGEEFDYIPANPGALVRGREAVIAEMAKATMEPSTGNAMLFIEQDLEKALAIPPAPGSARIDPAERTATGASIRQSNAQARMAVEQKRVAAWIVRIVRKLDSLVQQFADDDQYVEVVGRDGAAKLARWNRHLVAGRYAYDVSLDTQLFRDAVSRREQLLRLHNFVGASPLVNQQQWLKRLLQEFGIDAGALVSAPAPPPPEKPAVSFRFTGADLQSPLVLRILQKAGLVEESDLPPPGPEAPGPLEGQPPVVPGGTAPEAARLSRRAEETTGRLTGPSEQPRVM